MNARCKAEWMDWPAVGLHVALDDLAGNLGSVAVAESCQQVAPRLQR
jgi:hypothetical protein